MKNLYKKYKTPTANITKFECADIITTSEQLRKAPRDYTDPKTYVKAGSSTWSDGFLQ